MLFTRFVTALFLFAFLASPASADQVILDDLIATFSSCVGTACVDGEDFGFDSLRLKEDVIRIRFVDTSNSASFPTNDWQIVINDDDIPRLYRIELEIFGGSGTRSERTDLITDLVAPGGTASWTTETSLDDPLACDIVDVQVDP